MSTRHIHNCTHLKYLQSNCNRKLRKYLQSNCRNLFPFWSFRFWGSPAKLVPDTLPTFHHAVLYSMRFQITVTRSSCVDLLYYRMDCLPDLTGCLPGYFPLWKYCTNLFYPSKKKTLLPLRFWDETPRVRRFWKNPENWQGKNNKTNITDFPLWAAFGHRDQCLRYANDIYIIHMYALFKGGALYIWRMNITCNITCSGMLSSFDLTSEYTFIRMIRQTICQSTTWVK